jgi:hypothetical protein
MTTRKNKTKAQIEAELAESTQQLAESQMEIQRLAALVGEIKTAIATPMPTIAHPAPVPFSESLFGRIVGYLPTVIPWALALGAIIYIYRARMVDETVTPPTPTPDVPSITKAVGDYFPTQRKDFAKAFSDAAAKVRAKEIINDEQLDALINPQLKAARDLAGKPFDVSFDMGLPRNDDGTFSGKEEAAAKFLEQISRSW